MTATTESVIEHLISSLRDSGGDIKNIKLKNLGDEFGYGIITAAPLKVRDEIMMIPISFCITHDNVKRQLMTIINDADWIFEENACDEVLSLFLMNEKLKGEESEVRDFILTLPETFNSPMMWSENERKFLNGSLCSTLSMMMLDRMESDWNSLILPIVNDSGENLKKANFSLYMWAMNCVWSRAFTYVLPELNCEQRCLIPLLSAANHHSTAALQLIDVVEFDAANQCFRVYAGKDYGDNEQLYILYGKYTNSKLLYTYGFVEELNPYMGVDMWVDVLKSDPNFSQKNEVLQSNELTSTRNYNFNGTIRKLRGGDVEISAALLATVRIAQFTSFEIVSNDCISQAMSGTIVSVENERAAYKGLNGALAQKAAKLSSSLNELRRKKNDSSFQSSISLNRMKMAETVLKDELDVVSSAINLIEVELEMLQRVGKGYIPIDNISRDRYMMN